VCAFLGISLLAGSFWYWFSCANTSNSRRNPDFQGGVCCLVFSPDGKTLASSEVKRGVELLDIASNRKRLLSWKPEGLVLAMAFSPDGRILAVGGRQFLRLFRVDNGLQLKSFANEKGEPVFVTALAFSPDGKNVAAGTGPGENSVSLCDLEAKRWKTVFRGDPTYDVTGIVFSPDARMLIATSYDGLIRMFDFRTQKHSIIGSHVFNGYSQGALYAAVDRSGTKLATGGIDKAIKLWDISINQDDRISVTQEDKILFGHSEQVNAVAFSLDGKVLFSASGERLDKPGEIKVWDVRSGNEIVSIKAHQGPVLCLAVSPDGAMLVSGGKDEVVKWWTIADLLEGKVQEKRGQ
jgi:WD40 repeat protein